MIRRLVERWRGARCPICRERTRYLATHVQVDHTEWDPVR